MKSSFLKQLVILGCAGLLAAWFTLREHAPLPHLLSSRAISGVVVPHHNIVADQREKFFSDVAARTSQPKAIILVSPNHYDAGRAPVQTTDQSWKLGEGSIAPARQVIASLVQQGFTANEPSSFVDEHGIYNILGDIQKYFPGTPIIPLIFKEVPEDKLIQLERALRESCEGCLMIASVDFSHYQPALLAQIHDERSIRDLETLNTAGILASAEVDSGPSLALLALWAADHDTSRFVVRAHTNSGIINESPDLESTTHVFGWYEEGKQVEPEQSVSFLVGGDMMFARMIYHQFGTNFNDAVAHLGNRVFWGTDAAIVNLEGAITNQPIKDDLDNPRLIFHFSPMVAKTLSWLHINGASQANNHSNNAGSEGIATTRSVLADAHIQSFGGPTESSISQVARFTGQGLTLAVVGINLTFPGQKAEAALPVITELKKDPTVRVMVMPHWGTEYFAGHTQAQSDAAHAWIDAGADIVIGAHPHVIEDGELYREAPIIYSLGNLLFDQSFSRATQEGLLIGGKFTSSGLTWFGLPTQSVAYKPELMRGQRKKDILEALYKPFKDYLHITSAGTVVQIIK
jgi:AmmeMemoRadiSam system protein B